MQRSSIINRVAIGTAAALGILVGSSASAQLRIGIQIGIPTPPPRHEPVVVEYRTYYVGYRRALYDADLRLRIAQTHQWQAADDLDAAKHREGELAVVVDEQEALVARYANQAAVSEEVVTQDRARLAAFQKRVESAHGDLDAARTLNDAPGIADAQARIQINEAAAAKAADELHAAEEFATVRAQLADAQAHLPEHRAQLGAAQDDVFASRQRLEVATQEVADAMHDRDEAMWCLYRNDIMTGRCDFDRCGFHIDLGVWGGHMPRDPEVVHMYFVHPAGYWVERPAEIQTRIIEVDRVPEIARAREMQRSHEGARVVEIEAVERRVPAERRVAYAQRVTVERQRLVAEKTERAAATAEHRAPRLGAEDRAEAKAAVIEARGQAKANQIEAHANAKAEVTEARADAKVKETEARANARATETEARADAKSKETTAAADAKAKETEARGDAKSKEIEAKADAKETETKAKADAKNSKTAAAADARSKSPTVSGKPDSTSSRGGSAPSDSRSAKATTDDKKNPRDPKNKKDDVSAIDPNR